MTDALIKREEEPKGMPYSYKHRRCAIPSSLLTSHCASHGKVSSPEKSAEEAISLGRADDNKESADSKGVCFYWNRGDRGHQGEFGGK